MSKCPILGCNIEFVLKEQAELHAANTWHCIGCGYSDGSELTLENVGDNCINCRKSKQRCIHVDFRRKAYVVEGRLSKRENGKWVHYE